MMVGILLLGGVVVSRAEDSSEMVEAHNWRQDD